MLLFFFKQYAIKQQISFLFPSKVEVSSPSAESENTLCTNSILGTTMCTKIMQSSSTNPPNTPALTRGNDNGVEDGNTGGCSTSNSSRSSSTSSNGGTGMMDVGGAGSALGKDGYALLWLTVFNTKCIHFSVIRLDKVGESDRW